MRGLVPDGAGFIGHDSMPSLLEREDRVGELLRGTMGGASCSLARRPFTGSRSGRSATKISGQRRFHRRAWSSLLRNAATICADSSSSTASRLSCSSTPTCSSRVRTQFRNTHSSSRFSSRAPRSSAPDTPREWQDLSIRNVDNSVAAGLQADKLNRPWGLTRTVGSGSCHTPTESLDSACEAVGRGTEPISGPPRAGYLARSQVDCALARWARGHGVTVPFGGGIAETEEWYRGVAAS
jgi:hypothetical protein